MQQQDEWLEDEEEDDDDDEETTTSTSSNNKKKGDDEADDERILLSSNYWGKYKRAILLMLKDQSSRKSRMEAVLALGRLQNVQHVRQVLEQLFPPVCKKPLIRSVAVWRLLSFQWGVLIETP